MSKNKADYLVSNGQAVMQKGQVLLVGDIAVAAEAVDGSRYVIYTKKTGSLPYGPQFPRKQWRRVAA